MSVTVRPLPDDPGRTWTDIGVFEVSPGIHRIPLPIPLDGLRAVNVYAVESDGGLGLVDAGTTVPVSRETLESGLSALGWSIRDLQHVLVTHLHYDHFGLALQLRAELGTRVLLGRGEYRSLQSLMTRPNDPWRAQLRVLRTCGADELANEVESTGHLVPDLPPGIDWLPTAWLAPADVVSVSGRSIEVVHTPGHTQGHVVYIDPAADVAFTGDHVLPTITPSMGVEPVPGDLVLGDFLGSLATLLQQPDRTLLPAHGPIGPSVHYRVRQLLQHHADRLDAIERIVGDGTGDVPGVAARLPWTRRGLSLQTLDVFNRMLAVLETRHHLDLLEVRGIVTRVERNGVLSYRLA